MVQKFTKLFLTTAFWAQYIINFFVRPKTLGVRVLVEHEGKILLLKHSYRPKYYFPGGGVKRGEHLIAAAEREVFEETGLKVSNLKLLGVYREFSDNKDNTGVVFTTDKVANPKDLKADKIEIEDVGWYSLDQLPPDISKGTTERIKEYFEGLDTSHSVWYPA